MSTQGPDPKELMIVIKMMMKTQEDLQSLSLKDLQIDNENINLHFEDEDEATAFLDFMSKEKFGYVIQSLDEKHAMIVTIPLSELQELKLLCRSKIFSDLKAYKTPALGNLANRAQLMREMSHPNGLQQQPPQPPQTPQPPQIQQQQRRRSISDPPIVQQPNSGATVAPSTTAPLAPKIQVQTAGELEQLFVTQPMMRPSAPTQAPTSTPVLNDPFTQFKEIKEIIEGMDDQKKQAFGISAVDLTKATGEDPVISLDIKTGENKTGKAYIKPATEEGGIVYSIEPSQVQNENKKLIENLVKLEVENAKPGTPLTIPNSPFKSMVEAALDEAMNKKYGQGNYQKQNGTYTIPSVTNVLKVTRPNQ